MDLLPRPAWMRHVQVGDVLRKGSGPFRVVREVARRRDGRLRSVTFAIRRCSWTHRCYTVYNESDLRVLGYRRVRVKRRALRARIDKAIYRAIHEPSDRRSMTCCDVEGVA
jgi:hypothetical protein